MTNSCVTLSPDSLYWSIAPLPAFLIDKVRQGRPTAVPLLAIEDHISAQIPIDVEIVSTASVAVGELVVTCGLPRSELHRLLQAYPSIASIIPADMPECITAQIQHAHSQDLSPQRLLSALELMRGPDRPLEIFQSIRRRLWCFALTLFAAATLIAVVERSRAQDDRRTATVAKEKAHASLQMIAAPELPNDFNFLARHLRTELDAARTVDPLAAPEVDDAAGILASLLTNWPTDCEVSIDRLSVSQSSIHIQCSAATREDASRFVSAINVPDGWTLAPPRMTAPATRTILSLHMHR
jgi:hypothetical protein